MHPSDLHRVRVLTPETVAMDAAAVPAQSPLLNRQAELFARFRELAAAEQQSASEASRDEPPPEGDTPAAHPEAACHARHAPPLYGTQAMRRGAPMATAFVPPGTVAALADLLKRDPSQSGSDNPSGQQDDGAQEGQSSANHDNHDETPASAASRVGLNAGSDSGPDAGSGTPHLAAPLRTTALDPAAALTPAREAPPRLVDYLVSQAAEFCSNPAVLARGSWQLTIALDPRQLPECNLHLSLSYFDLTLRFETAEPTSRQLISVHTETLHERLAGLLKHAAPGAPRNIEITVS